MVLSRPCELQLGDIKVPRDRGFVSSASFASAIPLHLRTTAAANYKKHSLTRCVVAGSARSCVNRFRPVRNINACCKRTKIANFTNSPYEILEAGL